MILTTHTTIASYSCSMRGYFPEDHDCIQPSAQSCVCIVRRYRTYRNLLSLDRVRCDDLAYSCRAMERPLRPSEGLPHLFSEHCRRRGWRGSGCGEQGRMDGACRDLSDVRTRRSAEPSNSERPRPITSSAFPGVPLNHLFVASGFDEFGHAQDDGYKSTFST